MPNITPDLLRWARETAGLKANEAARMLQIEPRKLAMLEAGQAALTRTELKEMAKQYRRPLAVFYLSKPPAKAPRGDDFRRSPKEPELDALLRNLLARHSLLKQTLIEEGSPELGFVGSANLELAPRDLAAFIAKEIDLGRERVDFARLRDLVEQRGVFLWVVASEIDADAFRAYTIADQIAPFIVINANTPRNAWSRIILRELARICLGKTGLSGAQGDNPIERYCSAVAARLLPEPGLESSMKTQEETGRLTAETVARGLAAQTLSPTKAGFVLDESPFAVERIVRERAQGGR